MFTIMDQEQGVELFEMKQKECPRSIVERSPDMFRLVKEISVANTVGKKTGTFPGGVDQSKWPIQWFDAVYMDIGERERLQSSYDEAADAARPR